MGTETGKVYAYYASHLGIGEIERHHLEFDNTTGVEPITIWVKIKNTTNIGHVTSYLAGPFVLYFDIRLFDYHHSQSFLLDDPDIPRFETNLLPQRSTIVPLKIPQGEKRHWVFDTISEILFSKKSKVSFEIAISSLKELMKGKLLKKSQIVENEYITLKHINTSQLWDPNFDNQENETSDNIHLVILTHGIHSNASVDMLYMKEQIQQYTSSLPRTSSEKFLIKGYTGNVCETEKGIKHMGVKLAKYIVHTLFNKNIKKISFIGHSLGGLVQTFAIAYISILYPWFFQRVDPINFITLASPLLGVHSDSPNYVKYALHNGMMGKAGLDLNLEKDIENDNSPLLLLLSGEPTTTTLRMFERRTIYGNSINDGIVPLYTSSLLYIDFDDVLIKLAEFNKKNHVSKSLPRPSVISSITSVVFPPKPNQNYIIDVMKRDTHIIHDKTYDERDIIMIQDKYKDTKLRKYLKPDSKSSYKIVKLMADNWHRGISWRKVIAAMKPDAHNNIIVRRRFGNAYGWPIIDHLVSNHFNTLEMSDSKKWNNKANVEECLFTVKDNTAEEFIATTNENNNIDPNKLYAWLTRIDHTCQDGLLTNVSNLIQRSFDY